jgi:hypothetical protein
MNDQSHRDKPLWQQAPTRRETFLFGLVLLAIVWLMMSHYPTKIISVPDALTSASQVV